MWMAVVYGTHGGFRGHSLTMTRACECEIYTDKTDIPLK